MISAIDINKIVKVCEDNDFFDRELLSKTNKAAIVKCIFDQINEGKEECLEMKNCPKWNIEGNNAIELLRRGNIKAYGYDEALDEAEKCINRNIPKMAVIRQVLKKDKKGNMKQKWTHVCPNCGEEVKDHEKYYTVICHMCGQKIDYNYLHYDEM